MALAVLALGSNIGDASAHLAAAIEAIANHTHIKLLRQSTIIVTPPWGVTEQAEFHNGALLVETDLTPIALLDFCLATETELGRVRTLKWGPRIIDIDVIAYDRIVMDSERLTLPHPYAHEREFVLEPVREIEPDVADWLLTRPATSPH